MSHLHRIRKLGLINAYLVEEDDGLTLVDTAMRADRTILRTAERLGRPITRIVLTHAHADHVGSLDALKAALPAAEVSIGERDAPILAGDRTLRAGEPGKLRGGFAEVTTVPDRLLRAGDRVGSLEVVAAPGHTPGQIALLDVRDRALLCGDAFSSAGGVATSAETYWRFPLPGSATWHKPTALQTARELAALAPARLAPGHGPIIDQPAGLIAKAIARVA